jgi:Flp pilus assembly protein TadD
MLRAGELELASGEADRAVSWATRAIAISPGNERAGRLHASCLAALGDRVTAARELRAMMATLAAERLEPEPETRRLLRRIEGTASGGQAVAG